MSKLLHPDKNEHKEEFAAAFKRMQNAYEELQEEIQKGSSKRCANEESERGSDDDEEEPKKEPKSRRKSGSSGSEREPMDPAMAARNVEDTRADVGDGSELCMYGLKITVTFRKRKGRCFKAVTEKQRSAHARHIVDRVEGHWLAGRASGRGYSLRVLTGPMAEWRLLRLAERWRR